MSESRIEQADLSELPDEVQSSRRARRQLRKQRKTRRIAFTVIGSILAVLVAAAGIGYAMLLNTYNQVERVSIRMDPDLKRPPVIEHENEPPINILLLGSDTRIGLEHDASLDEKDSGQTDVIIVAQISPDRQHLTLMSIMRDNWVEVQGVGEDKINRAIRHGGVPLIVNTVENFIGTRIDHVAIVDFTSFAGITDALGGVTIDNKHEFHNINGTGLTGKRYPFLPGEITLTGDQAIAYVRERYSFSDGDFTRVRNQQTFLKGMMKQMLSRDTLSSPDKIMGVFQALQPYLILDEGLDLNTAVSLGLELRDLRNDDIEFFTSPTLGGTTAPDGSGDAIVLPRWDDIAKIQEAFQQGKLYEYAKDLPERSEIKPTS